MQEEGEVAFTSRVCRGAAEHILQAMGDARGEWRQEQQGRAPKRSSSRSLRTTLEQVRLRLPSPQLSTRQLYETPRSHRPHIHPHSLL